MGLFGRQDSERGRTPEERAHARAVREARRRGLPEPPPPHQDFDVEPVAARLPEREAEAAAVSARAAVRTTWDEVPESDPSAPHGDPLVPDARPDLEPQPEAERAPE